MGQKINPISMRLQVTKDWKSKWFATRSEYRALLAADLAVRALVDEKYSKRGAINDVEIERSPNLVTITLKTAKPGVVIGRGGAGVEELKTEITKILKTQVRVRIEELKKPELYAKLVAENIANQLERRIAFRRAIKSAQAATMRAGAKGIKIQVSGRLNGQEMARLEKHSEGSVPLQTIRANIDYHLAVAKTPTGLIGVKVWINKGESIY